MSQEIEIEYKVLLTKEQYERLAKELPFSKRVSQINYYFETDNLQLKSLGSALRIRKKHDDYVLTLKEPHKDGILETHDKLTEEEFQLWTNGNPVAKPHTNEQFNQLGISVEQLNYYGHLTTDRKTFTEEICEYFLDKSYYLDTIDYELEIEAPTKEQAFTAFQVLLEKYSIERQAPITKTERFFHLLANKNDNKSSDS